MKLQIDTIEKIIRIEEQVSLEELFNKLNILFPDNSWKEYKLETTNINNWSNPIIIREKEFIPYINYPSTPTTPWWTQPYVTCSTDNIYNAGKVTDTIVYNVQC